MCCLAAVPSCSRAQSRRARAVQAQGLEEILRDLRLLQPPAHKQSPVRSAGPAGLTHAVVGIVNKSGWKLPGRCVGFGWRGDFVAAHGTASPISVRPSYSISFFLSCCWARGPSSRSPLSRWSELRPGRAAALRGSRGATASVTSVRILCLCFKGLPSLPSLGSAAAFRSRRHRWRCAHPAPAS